ncbi:MAG TPA: M28 family peptidase [Nannocystaceae bacterium]|nr:M28 family peptidase [Nannocystaceae bacterium]
MRWTSRVCVLGVVVSCGGDGSSAESAAESDSSSTSPTTSGSATLTTTTTTDATTQVDSSTSSSSDASSDDASSETGTPSCDDLPAAITAEGLQAHLVAFDELAIANGGNRAVGSPGYDASLDYVRTQLEGAGYAVASHDFDVNVFSILGPSSLSWQGEQSYVEWADFQVAIYSAPGDVSATARAVDVQLGLGNNSTSGCEAGDFAGFPAGSIAVIQRGTCYTFQKVLNAQDAGAVGAIIFNQGNDDSRMGVWLSGLGAETYVTIPVLLTTYGIGAAMAQAPAGSVTAAMDVDVQVDLRPTSSLVAETASGDPNDVIMLGAHLDSVPAGPGINDNATGSAALLEIARALEGCATTRRVRFGWWAAEEVGLVGSQHYVDGLDEAGRAAIAAYVNFDMLGSPNWIPYRHDGDGSAYGTMGPEGSAELESVLAEWFDMAGIGSVEAPFDGRSDYGPFVSAGIAAGGVATGAENLKSPQEAELFGGQANQPCDACYHGMCDTIDNVDLDILTTMAGAGAHAVQHYALP